MASMQSSNRIIMIRPACFCFNSETATSNAFQNTKYAVETSSNSIQQRALIEFDRMVEKLRSLDVHVDVIDDTPQPIKPDAIFPNNWFSTHADGSIVLYPMMAENRRLERRDDLIKQLCRTYHVTARIDLTVFEVRNQFLEGTGSLVLDRINRIIYAIRSPRTHETIIERLTKLLNYPQPPVIFDSVDANNKPIYHTNVMMAIGTYIAIVCLESIVDKQQREHVRTSLEKNGQRQVVPITFEQMNQFAGNMLEVQGKNGQLILVMSKAAYEALNADQRHVIEQTGTQLAWFDIETIEQCGGGSVRCMIAENFLSEQI